MPNQTAISVKGLKDDIETLKEYVEDAKTVHSQEVETLKVKLQELSKISSENIQNLKAKLNQETAKFNENHNSKENQSARSDQLPRFPRINVEALQDLENEMNYDFYGPKTSDNFNSKPTRKKGKYFISYS